MSDDVTKEWVSELKLQDMTMRDIFAGFAMIGLICSGVDRPKMSPDTQDIEPDQPWYFGGSRLGCANSEDIWGESLLAMDAYHVADAMLNARTQCDTGPINAS